MMMNGIKDSSRNYVRSRTKKIYRQRKLNLRSVYNCKPLLENSCHLIHSKPHLQTVTKINSKLLRKIDIIFVIRRLNNTNSQLLICN